MALKSAVSSRGKLCQLEDPTNTTKYVDRLTPIVPNMALTKWNLNLAVLPYGIINISTF